MQPDSEMSVAARAATGKLLLFMMKPPKVKNANCVHASWPLGIKGSLHRRI
jgi:hypothetical protein